MTKNKKSLPDPDLNESRFDEFATQYSDLEPKFRRLTEVARGEIVHLLDGARISYLDVVARVKEFESALGKIKRKQYANPFEQIEDWCGLRVICYYPSDIEKIASLLTSEFVVDQQEDTVTRLRPHEFGYRSLHLILRLKSSWLEGPVYRGLGEIKFEVQVRTILMHAWAEIEHKLAYKSNEQVPDQFRRKLYRLSAKFEEADEQFEELRGGLAEYRKSLIESTKRDEASVSSQQLNLDSLQAYLDAVYPTRVRYLDDAAELLAEIIPLGLTMSDLVDAQQRVAPIFDEMVRIGWGDKPDTWTQVGAMRTVLDTANDRYYAVREQEYGEFEEWASEVEADRELLANYEKAASGK